jgi:hypothetical protein
MNYENTEMNTEMENNEVVEETAVVETESKGFFAKVGAGIKKHAKKIALAGAAIGVGCLVAHHIKKTQEEMVDDTDVDTSDDIEIDVDISDDVTAD